MQKGHLLPYRRDGADHCRSRAAIELHRANGNYAGSAFRYPESTTFVDRNGSFAGTAIPHSGSTSFYDKSGRYTGSVTTQGTASNPLANVNGSNPFGRGGRR